MTAAYAEPCAVLALTINPAFDHGCTPWCSPVGPFGPVGTAPAGEYNPVSELIRVVIVPSPASGWCTNVKLSLTASPPGPVRTCGLLIVHLPLMHDSAWLPFAVRNASSTTSSAAATAAITQPRTVRNFVHSARSCRVNPSRPVRTAGVYGVI